MLEPKQLPKLLASMMLGASLLTFALQTSAADPKKPADPKAEKKEEAPAKAPAESPDEAPAEAPAPAAEAPPAPIKNPPLRLEIRRNQPLAKQIETLKGAQGNVVWLGEQADPFLGLYLESYKGEPLGAVLMLHDNEQHPDWPGLLHRLRTSFPEHRWSTLSIALPDYLPIPPILPPLPKPEPPAPPPQPPADTVTEGDKAKEAEKGKEKDDAKKDDKDKDKKKPDDKKDAKEADEKKENKDKSAEEPPAEAKPTPPPAPEFLQSDSEVPPEKYIAEVDNRLKNATRFLIQKGHQHVVIISFGSTAGLAAHLARNMLIEELDGLIIIDPKPFPAKELDLAEDVADLRVPLLDVVPEFEPSSNPLLRKQSTGRARTPQYEARMVRGAAVTFSGFEDYVYKAVRGWADTQFRNAPKKRRNAAPAGTAPAVTAPAQTPPTTPVVPTPTPVPATPAAPPPPGSNRPAPDLKEAIPPPIPE